MEVDRDCENKISDSLNAKSDRVCSEKTEEESVVISSSCDVIGGDLSNENCSDSNVDLLGTNNKLSEGKIAEVVLTVDCQNESEGISNVTPAISESLDCQRVDSEDVRSEELSGDVVHENITVEICDNVSVAETSSCQGVAVQTDRNSGAFTKFQESDSGTEDSQSDSTLTSDSESDSDTSSASQKSSDSESDESSEDDFVPEKTSNRESKTRNGGGTAAAERKKKQRVGTGTGTRYKDELDMDDLPPIEDLHITVLEEECEPLGTVYSIVNQLVVIESMQNKPALNLDSLLFKKDGSCLGEIFDVFGPVKTPFYSVRFNTKQDIIDKDIQVGQTVYCAPQTPYTKYVFVYQLMQQKGSDASWKHNYEVPDSHRDYSDDEEERKAKRRLHQRLRGRPGCAGDQSDDLATPQRKQSKSTNLVHDYSHYTSNEWYQARMSEMNQFNRGRRYNSKPDFNPASQRPNPFECSTDTPPPLIRPPMANNWNSAAAVGSSTQNPVSNNWSWTPTNERPPFSFKPPMGTLPPGLPPPFVRPPPSPSYEKLNSNVCFANPVAFSRPPPPVSIPWLQNQPQTRSPFRIDNTRKTNLIPPRPLATIPPLPRPNIQLNSHRPPWNSTRPPPPPHQSLMSPPNNYHQNPQF